MIDLRTDIAELKSINQGAVIKACIFYVTDIQGRSLVTAAFRAERKQMSNAVFYENNEHTGTGKICFIL